MKIVSKALSKEWHKLPVNENEKYKQIAAAEKSRWLIHTQGVDAGATAAAGLPANQGEFTHQSIFLKKE